MTRFVLAVGVCALLLGPVRAFAEDSAPAAPAGQPAAPSGEGCMPGGGCCGSGSSCPKAPHTDDGKAAGGCPCQKAKQAAQQAKPQANP